MSNSRRVTHIGAAACVLGFALLSHPTGVATADEGESGSTSQAGGAADNAHPGPARGQRSGRSGTQSPAADSAESATRRPAPTRSDGIGAGEPAPAASAVRDGLIGSTGSDSAPNRSAASRRAVAQNQVGVDVSAQAAGQPASATPNRAVGASSEPVPVAATTIAPSPGVPAPAAVVHAVPAATSAGSTQCLACLGLTAPTIGQGIATAINHVFNNAFDLLSTLPGSPISNFVEGGLVLIRRTFFGFVPTGVSATQVGAALNIKVNTGSVAYFRTTGTTIEVSGDPGFTKAQQFTASSVDKVLATANGNGNVGCAGFVFTQGTAGGDLIATGIDSLRFQSSAVFTGSVTAESVPGNLTLGQAVRGLAGVTFTAPVILASDTEVDAGAGSATFGGTVDGKGWFGGQSLLVTALDTTAFAGDVGGNSALGSLTTRGIAPLQIQQSADSKTIPLKYLPIGGEVKYGIDVAIGDNAARTYLFDTGGNGFFAGYDPAAFNGVTLGSEKTSITYTSGQTLDALVTPAIITVGSGTQSVSTGQPVDIAAVVSATNGSGQPISPNAPFGTQFAGDFGAAFGVQQINGKLLYLPGSFVTSVLFQLPGNLSSGYLTQLGPIGITPQMTVGVTDALRAQFPYAIPIDLQPISLPGFPGNYPVSGYPLLKQFGFNGTYEATGNINPLPGPPITVTVPISKDPLETLIDSGAGSTSLRLPDMFKPFDVDRSLKPGTIFTATFPTTQGREPLVWEYTAGTIPSVNQIGYLNETGAATDNPNVNTGLNLFNDFDVMYDVAERVIWLRPNGGQSTVTLQSVTTKGDQSFGQNARLNGTYTTNGHAFSVGGMTQLNGSTRVDAGRDDVTFSGTVDAATPGVQWLQVNSRGTTNFVRQVGGVNPLATLTTDAPGSTSTAGVTTTGAQTYNDDLAVNGSYAVTKSGGFTAAKSTTLAGGSSVSTTDGPITFGGTVDSTDGKGSVLGVSAPNSTVTFNAEVGSKSATSALGGLNLNGSTSVDDTSVVTAKKSVTLNGSLLNSQGAGLFVGNGVTVDFARGGGIADFTVSGVQFNGDSTDSILTGFTIADNVYDGIQFGGQNYAGALISGNTIKGNSAFGIETLQATNGLTIRDNVIGTQGTSSEWNYTFGGPNAHGVVLAPGDYTATVIADNTIQYNRRDGIAAPDGVQGVVISGNTIAHNQGNGIEFTGGDFTGTIVTGNTITNNGADGILLGAGIGQALNDFGNPLTGYRNGTGGQDVNPYSAGHYTLPWVTDPGFYTGVPNDPLVHLSLNGGRTLTVGLDTGSRGLFVDQNSASNLDTTTGTKGYIYLNSSNRIFFGTWVDSTITFPDSSWVGPDTPNAPPVATAKAPVLVVSALGASMTPPPGSTTPSASFATKADTGSVTITNGTQTRQVAITPGYNGGGSVTIPGGWWATYDANPVLAPASNFGVGFDRSALGTEPLGNGVNQDYNVFLNLEQMQHGTMRPGYIVANDGVTLGLDHAALQGNAYAYTDLAPSGLSQDGQSAPDWQPATGRFTWTPDPQNPSQKQTSDLGPLVIDLGIPTGIMTLPGQSATNTFTGFANVDLLNSGGKVGYVVNPGDADNKMTPTSVAFFDPLAGAYSQSMPPLSQQFFNTGRRLVAGMNYLYDAAGGYEGLWAPTDPADTSDQAKAFRSGGGSFDAAYFENVQIPDQATNLVIQNNTIADNAGTGVVVNGPSSTGNVINENVMYGNAGGGIALTNGGNAGQPAPVVRSAVLADKDVVVVQGSVVRINGYSGTFQLQVFNNPASDAGNIQGRQLLGTISKVTDGFNEPFAANGLAVGDFITIVATPEEGTPNSSEFSVPVVVRA